MKTATAAICLLAMLSVLAAVATGQPRVQFPGDVPLIEQVPGPSNIGPYSPVTLEGGIAPPPATWDPYGTAGPQPSTLLEQDPYLPFDGYDDLRQRLIKEIRFEYLWMPGKGPNEFGIDKLELSTTVSFPFLYQAAPLLVTPGFAVNYWRGPAGVPLPPRVYDAYLDAAWNPQIIPTHLSAELNFRIGIYSDFKEVTSDSIRYMGQGFFVLALSRSFDVKAGVMYLDRNRIKMLPSGGVIWKPSQTVRFDILFPNPKFAWQLSVWGNTVWWGYLSADYGGDAWTVTLPGLGTPSLDYNDIRCAMGVEFNHMGGTRTGFFEVGIAFERELYRTAVDPLDLHSTAFVRGGIAF